MGLSGTFVGKWLIAGAGLLRTGIIASTFQAAVLGSAAFIYHLHLRSPSLAVVSRLLCFPGVLCSMRRGDSSLRSCLGIDASRIQKN